MGSYRIMKVGAFFFTASLVDNGLSLSPVWFVGLSFGPGLTP